MIYKHKCQRDTVVIAYRGWYKVRNPIKYLMKYKEQYLYYYYELEDKPYLDFIFKCSVIDSQLIQKLYES